MLRLVPSDTRRQGNCLQCNAEVMVSQFADSIRDKANAILKGRNERPITEAEGTLCRNCYDEMYQRTWERQRAESDAVSEGWRKFKEEYAKEQNADRRQRLWLHLERKMRISGYWESYSGIAISWKAEQDMKATKNRSKGKGF